MLFSVLSSVSLPCSRKADSDILLGFPSRTVKGRFE